MKNFLTGVLLLLTTILKVSSYQPEVETDQLDLALSSVDDRYEGCREDMMQRVAAEGGLLDEEKMADGSFSAAWRAAERCSFNSSWHPPSRLTSLHKTALALYAARNDTFPEIFDIDSRYLAASQHVYREYFLYKSLHFLLTDAVQILKEEEGGGEELHCRLVYADSRSSKPRAKVGNQVRMGGFRLASSLPANQYDLTLRTCHGVKLLPFSKPSRYECSSGRDVLVPPYEQFAVVAVKRPTALNRYSYGKDRTFILESQGAFSNLRCAIQLDTIPKSYA